MTNKDYINIIKNGISIEVLLNSSYTIGQIKELTKQYKRILKEQEDNEFNRYWHNQREIREGLK